MKPHPIFALHYLFTKKPDKVVAHCLDFDLVAVGKNEQIAEKRLNTLVQAQFAFAFRHRSEQALLFAAPPSFWAELRYAAPLAPATLQIEIPPMVVSVEQAIKTEMPVLRAELTQAA